MFYPFYKSLQELSQDMTKGNYGLWYNKFIPITDYTYKPCDSSNDKDKAVEYYEKKYSSVDREEIIKLLEKKHLDQVKFCQAFSIQYALVTITAKLKTPLITGIGESHPHEVSMVFEHNLGIPYIRASGIKGIVRFAHTLGLIDCIPEGELKPDGSFNDEAEWTHIPVLFGTQKNRGRVVFLDAYPESIPALHVDIMNPHYGDYYNDDNHKTPPADYLNPVPLKFLTIAKGTVFVFRALIDKKQAHLVTKVKEAFTQALSREGVGAKTAIGYGIFEILTENEPESIVEMMRKEQEKDAQNDREEAQKAETEKFAALPEDDKLIIEINKLQKDPNQIAPLVKRCLDGNFQKRVYVTLKTKLEQLGEWQPAGSKKRKEGMKERNQKIAQKIGEVS